MIKNRNTLHICIADSQIVGFAPKSTDNNYTVLAARNPNGDYVVAGGNFSDAPQPVSVEIGKKYLNVTLAPHSFNSFVVK